MSGWLYIAIAAGLLVLLLYGASAAAQHAADQARKQECWGQLFTGELTPVAFQVETRHPVKLGASETVPSSLWYNNPEFQHQVVNRLADKMKAYIVPELTVRISPDWMRDAVRIEAVLYVCKKETP